MSEPGLSLRGVGKDYGARRAVAAIDLDVMHGECVGLLGPNGAGKTTTISMACGVLTPSRGAITIDGIDLHADPFAAKAKLGYVPQDLALYDDLTAIENLRYFGALYGLTGTALAERIDWVLGVIGLADRAREPIKRYSGGMKRRLNLGAGLLHRPALLVLDEPTVGVDPQSRHHLFETIRRLHAEGTSILYTSHYLEEAEALCDRVAIIDAGAIIASGAPKELARAHGSDAIVVELEGGDAEIAAAVTGAERTAKVSRTGATLRLVPHGSVAATLAAIEDAGTVIRHIESQRASLETVFLALTGRELRDKS